jgi:hypothetical protein
MVAVYIVEKVASTYQYAKCHKMVALYLSERLAPTYTNWKDAIT